MVGRYVDKVLQQGEQVRYNARLNWILYLPGLLCWLAAAFIYLAFGGPGGFGTIARLAALLVFAAGLVVIARAWFRWWTTEIAVTNRRVIYKTGFISWKTTEMHMDKVESVDVEQSVLGRMFNYGDVVVRGTGSGLEPLRSIDAPLELRNHITGV